MADNINVTAGTGTTMAADEVTDGTLGSVKVGFGKIMDGTLDSTNKLIVNASGEALVKHTDAIPVTDNSGSLTVDDGGGSLTVDGTVTANLGTGTGDVNVKQINGTTADTNSGVKSAGTQRVVLATDQPQLTNALKVDGSAVTQPVSGTVTETNSSTVATNTGNTATNTTNIPNVVGTAASAIPSKLLQVGGSDGTNARAIKTNTSGQVDIRPLTSSDAVSASNLPTTVDTNSGNKSASTLRVVLATDQPSLTNAVPVSDNSGSLTVDAPVGTPVFTTVTPSTTGGWSVSSATALSNTKTAVKAGAGTFGGYMIYNPNSSAVYIQVWNVAIGSITVGTTAPTYVLTIPATSAANLELTNGVNHSTEINIAATTTATGSTAPSTAVTAAIFYK